MPLSGMVQNDQFMLRESDAFADTMADNIRQQQELDRQFKLRQKEADRTFRLKNPAAYSDVQNQQRMDFLFNGTVPNSASVGNFTDATGRRTAVSNRTAASGNPVRYFPTVEDGNTRLALQQAYKGGELTPNQIAGFRDSIATAFTAPKVPVDYQNRMTEYGTQQLRDYYGTNPQGQYLADQWSDDEKQQKYLEMQRQLAGEKAYEDYQAQYNEQIGKNAAEYVANRVRLAKQICKILDGKLLKDENKISTLLFNRVIDKENELREKLQGQGLTVDQMNTRIQRDPGLIQLKNQHERFKEISRPVDVQAIIDDAEKNGIPDPNRTAEDGNVVMMPYNPANEAHKQILQKQIDSAIQSRKDRIADFIKQYNSGIDSEIKKLSDAPEFRLRPAPEATGADPKRAEVIYRDLMNQNANAFELQKVTNENDPEYQDRLARYENIQSAAAHGNVLEVYNMLTPEERKKLFPGYTPELQQSYNLYWDQKKNSPEYKEKQARAAEVDYKARLQQYSQNTHSPEDVAVGYVYAGAKFSSLPADQQTALKKYLGFAENEKVTDDTIYQKVREKGLTENQQKYQPIYNARVNNPQFNDLGDKEIQKQFNQRPNDAAADAAGMILAGTSFTDLPEFYQKALIDKYGNDIGAMSAQDLKTSLSKDFEINRNWIPLYAQMARAFILQEQQREQQYQDWQRRLEEQKKNEPQNLSRLEQEYNSMKRNDGVHALLKVKTDHQLSNADLAALKIYLDMPDDSTLEAVMDNAAQTPIPEAFEKFVPLFRYQLNTSGKTSKNSKNRTSPPIFTDRGTATSTASQTAATPANGDSANKAAAISPQAPTENKGSATSNDTWQRIDDYPQGTIIASEETTWAQLAQKYGITEAELRYLNGGLSSDRIKKGKAIVVPVIPEEDQFVKKNIRQSAQDKFIKHYDSLPAGTSYDAALKSFKADIIKKIKTSKEIQYETIRDELKKAINKQIIGKEDLKSSDFINDAITLYVDSAVDANPQFKNADAIAQEVTKYYKYYDSLPDGVDPKTHNYLAGTLGSPYLKLNNEDKKSLAWLHSKISANLPQNPSLQQLQEADKAWKTTAQQNNIHMDFSPFSIELYRMEIEKLKKNRDRYDGRFSEASPVYAQWLKTDEPLSDFALKQGLAYFPENNSIDTFFNPLDRKSTSERKAIETYPKGHPARRFINEVLPKIKTRWGFNDKIADLEKRIEKIENAR